MQRHVHTLMDEGYITDCSFAGDVSQVSAVQNCGRKATFKPCVAQHYIYVKLHGDFLVKIIGYLYYLQSSMSEKICK